MFNSFELYGEHEFGPGKERSELLARRTPTQEKFFEVGAPNVYFNDSMISYI